MTLDPSRLETTLALHELFRSLGLQQPSKCFNRSTHLGGLFLVGMDISRSGVPQTQILNNDFEANNISISGDFDLPLTAPYNSK